MKTFINIPDDITAIKSVSQNDILLALAILFYVDDEVSLAKAADIAGINQFEFKQILAGKNIPLRYSLEDLEREMGTVKAYLSDAVSDTSHKSNFLKSPNYKA